jgi:uncharacterized ferritin-like protein (DUF455 family)
MRNGNEFDALSTEVRGLALQALICPDVAVKCAHVAQLTDDQPLDPDLVFLEPEPLPQSAGRPALPTLVAPTKLKHRSMQTEEGRSVLLHALAHIEFNAINLALDIVWRFDGLPTAFYRDWLKVAREEAYHFELLQAPRSPDEQSVHCSCDLLRWLVVGGG